MKNLIRLSKIISHAGICSRRDAEKLIEKGEVKVNGEILKEFVIAQDKIRLLKKTYDFDIDVSVKSSVTRGTKVNILLPKIKK